MSGGASGGAAFPPPGFVDQSGAAALFGIGSSQLYDWIRQGRLGCRGELVNRPNGTRGRVWPIAELEQARAAMANPDGWVPAEQARALFGVSANAWNHWVKDKRVPVGRWGHAPATGKRCLLFPLDELKRLKARRDEERAQAQRALEPYPDPDRPSVYRLPVASDKHKGMEAQIDADTVPLVQGKRWNWSPGSGGRTGSGSVVCQGPLSPSNTAGGTSSSLVAHLKIRRIRLTRPLITFRDRSSWSIMCCCTPLRALGPNSRAREWE